MKFIVDIPDEIIKKIETGVPITSVVHSEPLDPKVAIHRCLMVGFRSIIHEDWDTLTKIKVNKSG